MFQTYSHIIKCQIQNCKKYFADGLRAPEREQRVHPAAAEPPRARGPHHQLGLRRDGAQGHRRVPGTTLYCTVLYCTVLYCTVLYCTVLYCAVCTVLYCAVCTVLTAPCTRTQTPTSCSSTRAPAWSSMSWWRWTRSVITRASNDPSAKFCNHGEGEGPSRSNHSDCENIADGSFPALVVTHRWWG